MHTMHTMHRRRHSAPDLYELCLEEEKEACCERKAVTLEELEQVSVARVEVDSSVSSSNTIGYEDGSVDQETSRAVQKKIEEAGAEEVEEIYRGMRCSLKMLVTDLFGNYIVQRLIESGPPSVVSDIIEHVKENFIIYATNPYGCRIAQRCLTAAPLVILPFVKANLPLLTQDPNGNHVVQKCIEVYPPVTEFIVTQFKNQLVEYSVHPYGCRVIQRILEHAPTAEPIVPILQVILKKIHYLVADQYGNYVVQHVLTNGHPVYKESLAKRMLGHFPLLCTHKYASNVVEKMYEAASQPLRDAILMELTQPLPEDPMHSGLSRASMDQYGNYVAQKLYDLSTPEKKNVIRAHLRPYLRTMHNAPYGRHFASVLSM